MNEPTEGRIVENGKNTTLKLSVGKKELHEDPENKGLAR
jgi:hypothetical protein